MKEHAPCAARRRRHDRRRRLLIAQRTHQTVALPAVLLEHPNKAAALRRLLPKKPNVA
jgi:hypothetical protein